MSIYYNYEEYQNKRIDDAKRILKEISQDLLEAGITTIEAYYDGQGDSGEIEDIIYYTEDHNSCLAPVNPEINKKYKVATSRRYTTGGKGWEDVIEEEDLDDAVEICVYEILPGGWEINQGSFGTLIIDTEKCKIKLEHNERIESSDYSEEEWEM